MIPGRILQAAFLTLVLFGCALGEVGPPEIKPGETITNSIGMKLTLVPAGEFQMGTASDSGDEKISWGFAWCWFPLLNKQKPTLPTALNSKIV